jgi:hypothetical protein
MRSSIRTAPAWDFCRRRRRTARASSNTRPSVELPPTVTGVIVYTRRGSIAARRPIIATGYATAAFKPLPVTESETR